MFIITGHVRIFLFLEFIFCCTNSWSQKDYQLNDTLHIRSDFIKCFKASENKKGKRIIGGREWYDPDKNDVYTSYNRKGEWIEYRTYHNSGSLKSALWRALDPDGNEVQQHYFSIGDNGSYYMSHSNLTTIRNADSSVTQIDSSFNENGICDNISVMTFSGNKKSMSRISYHHNRLDYYQVTAFGSPGIQTTQFFNGDSLLEFVDYSEIDAADHKEIFLRTNGSGDTIFYRFSELDTSDRPLVSYEYSKDSNGSRTLKFIYTYDRLGNWIKKMVYDKEDNLIYYIEREIEYWNE